VSGSVFSIERYPLFETICNPWSTCLLRKKTEQHVGFSVREIQDGSTTNVGQARHGNEATSINEPNRIGNFAHDTAVCATYDLRFHAARQSRLKQPPK
jgi:hypothetical protein